MNATRLLVVGMLLVPALVLVAPTASAAACNPHFTGIPEIDGPEYGACVTALGTVNAVCQKAIHQTCIL